MELVIQTIWINSTEVIYPFGSLLHCTCMCMCFDLCVSEIKATIFSSPPSCKLWSDIWMLHLLFFHRCVLTHTNLCYNCLWDVDDDGRYNLATVVFGKGEWRSITCPDPNWGAQIQEGKPLENRKAQKFTIILTHRAYAGSLTIFDASVLQHVTSTLQ